MITTDKATAISKLRKQIATIDQIQKKPTDSQEFVQWKKETEKVVENLFGQGSHQLLHLSKIRYRHTFIYLSQTHEEIERSQRPDFEKGLLTAKEALESFIVDVEEYWPVDTKNPSSVGLNEVVDLRPNIFGLGLNINALIKKYWRK